LDARLAGQVSKLEITGENADVRGIELRLTGGDRSVMTLEPLVAAAAPASGRPATE
jgi:hypothetical protein